MKRIFCILILTTLTIPIFAQFVSVTPVMGVSISRFEKKSDFSGRQNRFSPGIMAGVLADYRLSDNLFLSPGLLVEQKGNIAIGDEGVKNGENKETLKLTYATLPVTMKFYATKNMFIDAGIYSSMFFRMLQKFSGPFGNEGADTSYTRVVSGFTFADRIDYGLKAGTGYLIPLPNNRALQACLDCEYSIKFGELRKKDRMFLLRLTLGYRFNRSSRR